MAGTTSDPLADPEAHRFVRSPHRALLALAFPALISLLAEPLTGLADTFFVARLGAAPLAALGIGTALLSGVFWVFNFIGIGTQTEVARALGGGTRPAAREVASLALALGALLGAGLAVVGWSGLDPAVRWMGAEGARHEAALVYLQIRILGAPAVLLMLAAFGALRGLQDMRTPLWIALAANALNIALDPLLIFGWGPVPALGVAGAAWSSTATQWGAALASALAVRRRLGFAGAWRWRRALDLLVVGRDLVIRTALLLGFQVLARRFANLAGIEAGAAHQAVRQFWLLTALALDAYAAAAQSLVGYFVGAGRVSLARRVAAVACEWSAATGALLAVAMWAGGDWIAAAFVPPEARAVFSLAWLLCAAAQPLNALAFATDGIHWGTSDYRYLRNGMVVATTLGGAALFATDIGAADALARVWEITAAWIGIRAGFGLLRIWPGVGSSPLAA